MGCRAVFVCLLLASLCTAASHIERVAAQSPSLPVGLPSNAPTNVQQGLLMIPGMRRLVSRLFEDLPVNLNAGDAYPEVSSADLPGGAFRPIRLHLSSADMYKALPPGDYTIPVLAFCNEYSIHQPGSGTAYALAPLRGSKANAVAALLWRGTLQRLATPGQLQGVVWSIEAGIPYANMPPDYQQLITKIIPEYSAGLQGDAVERLDLNYQTAVKGLGFLGRAAPPTLEAAATNLGPLGRAVLSLENTRGVLLTDFRQGQKRDQVLFAGQGSRLPPVPAANAPWSTIVPGQVYTRFTYTSGNLASDNILELRVLPGAAPTRSTSTMLATLVSDAPAQSAGDASAASVGSALRAPDATNQTGTGSVAYSQGGTGAQALTTVPVTECDAATEARENESEGEDQSNAGSRVMAVVQASYVRSYSIVQGSTSAEQSTINEKIANAVKKYLQLGSYCPSRNAANTDHGGSGCAYTVDSILYEVLGHYLDPKKLNDPKATPELLSSEMYKLLTNEKIATKVSEAEATPGTIIISATDYKPNHGKGHVGFCRLARCTKIASNSSGTTHPSSRGCLRGNFSLDDPVDHNGRPLLDRNGKRVQGWKTEYKALGPPEFYNVKP